MVPGIPDEEYLPPARVKLLHCPVGAACRDDLLREEGGCCAFSLAGVLAVERLDGGLRHAGEFLDLIGGVPAVDGLLGSSWDPAVYGSGRKEIRERR